MGRGRRSDNNSSSSNSGAPLKRVGSPSENLVEVPEEVKKAWSQYFMYDPDIVKETSISAEEKEELRQAEEILEAAGLGLRAYDFGD